MADEIDYRIHGEDVQAVEIRLDPGEAAIAEPGAMIYADDCVEMHTGTGGGLFGAAKRLLGGEQFFVTRFENAGGAPAVVGFAAPYPGRIVPLDLAKLGGRFLCQRDCYLCGADGTETEVAFSKRLGAGFFGGEGFVLQRVVGDGLAFVHAGGAVIERELAAGERIRVDTGCLVGMTEGVDYDFAFVGGITNTLFGGEGLFQATLEGPGTVYVQSMPFQRLVDRIASTLPRPKE